MELEKKQDTRLEAKFQTTLDAAIKKLSDKIDAKLVQMEQNWKDSQGKQD